MTFKKLFSVIFIVLALFVLTACEKSYYLRFDTKGGEVIAEQKIKEKSALSLPTPVKEGYFFVGWYADAGLTTRFSATEMPSEDTTIYAKWTKEDPELVAEATAAVVKAEGSQLQADVDAALALVDALPKGETQTALLERLDLVRDAIRLAAATAAVVTAEGSKLQADVDAALELIDNLPDGEDKTALVDRLDAVQDYIDTLNQEAEATAAVAKAEGSYDQEDANAAQALVNGLSNADVKTALQSRLNTLQTVINAISNATDAIVKAEGSYAQDDVDAAAILVSSLPLEVKNSLQLRLDSVQDVIDAIKTATAAVAKAEGSKLQADVDDAKLLVEALPDGAVKTDLDNRLDAVQAAINLALAEQAATAAVAKAEESKLQADVDAASLLVNALPDGAVKTDLNNRLDAVQAAINLALSEEAATSAVVKAEASKLQADADDAQIFIDALPSGELKTSLQDRLNVVKDYIEDVNVATAAVVKAEASTLVLDIKAAVDLVVKFPVDDLVRIALSDRLMNIVITPMEITTDIPDTFALYSEELISVGTIANSDAGIMVRAYFTLPVGMELFYQEPGFEEWLPLTDVFGPVAGFPLGDITTQFKAYFSEAGEFTVTIEFKDVLYGDVFGTKDVAFTVIDATSAESLVVFAEETRRVSDIAAAQAEVDLLPSCNVRTALQARLDAIVLVPMEIVTDIPDTFAANYDEYISVSTLANSYVGTLVRAYFTLPEGLTLSYQEQGIGEWLPLTNVFGPESGFPLGDITSPFKATFAAAGDYTVTIEFKDMDGNVLGTKDVTVHVIDASAAFNAVAQAEATQLSLDVIAAQQQVDMLPAGNFKPALQNRLVNIVITPMEITTDIPAVFAVNYDEYITVSTIANSYAGILVRAYFTLPEGLTLSYQEQGVGAWLPLTDVFGPETGFPLGNITTPFKATFAAAGEYTVTIEFKNSAENVFGTKDITVQVIDASAAFNAVAQAEASKLSLDVAAAQEQVDLLPASNFKTALQTRVDAIVVTPMTITADMAEFNVNEPQLFYVGTVANGNAGEMVRAHFILPEGFVLEYREQGAGEWLPLTDVFGPASGFPLGNIITEFRGTFTVAGTYTVTVQFITVDGTVLGTTYITPVVAGKVEATVNNVTVYNETLQKWFIEVSLTGESLDFTSVQIIHQVVAAGQVLETPVELTPDTDSVLWFSVALDDGNFNLKADGTYTYRVVRTDGSVYTFSFEYAQANLITIR